MIRALIRLLIAGAAAGLLAGALLGFAEGWAVSLGSSERIEAQALWFGPALYAVVMAAAGAGAGFALGLLGRRRPGERAFAAFLLPAVLFGGGFVFARFRINRDLLGEHAMPPLHQLALLGLFTLLFVLAWLVLRARARRAAADAGAPPMKLVGGAVAVIIIGAVCAQLVASPAAAPAPPEGGIPPALAGRPDVILIMVDTLRADRLPAYGYKGASTPAIDRLASDGVVFEKGSAQASWTKPSTATLLTGLYPSTHRAIGKVDRLPEEVDTLAESLAGAGWRTGGIVSNVNLAPSYQFDQGFGEYHYLAPNYFFGAKESSSKLAVYNSLRLVRERFLSRRKEVKHYYQDGATVTEAGKAWIDRNRGSRFFLFIHYMDPHDPYFRHPYDGTAVARVQTPNPDAARAGELSDLYDGEIEYLDGHLGDLFDHLREEGIYDGALIILTADHGEEFHEHGGWWHGTTLYEEQIHVPLIVKPAAGGPPGLAPGSRRADLARLLDVTPTVLDLAGVEAPARTQGASLAAGPVTGESFAEEDLEGNRLRSLRGDTWKTIEANADNPRGLPDIALYNLAEDPGETRNLAGDDEGRWKAMRGRMDHTMGEALKAAVAGEQVEVDDATRERLRALGYVE
ncbi:MAG: sulfatase [Deltaproteobacteria bacterium]|nr:sulfatase [Deltaproteobacteria bacterium]